MSSTAPIKPASYDADVKHIMSFYNASPQDGAEEVIEVEDSGDTKHYTYVDGAWSFKGMVPKSGLVVEPKTTTHNKNPKVGQKQRTGVSKEFIKVAVCTNPKRGMKKVVNGLSVLANLVSKGKIDQALIKIQNIMNDLDGDKIKQKKEPSPYNRFVAEHMAKLKEEDPTLNASERMKRTIQLWNAEKVRAHGAPANARNDQLN